MDMKRHHIPSPVLIAGHSALSLSKDSPLHVTNATHRAIYRKLALKEHQNPRHVFRNPNLRGQI